VTAYVISEVEVLDDQLIDTYRSLAKATIDQYGGRYIVRGGPVELMEGRRDPAKQFVIVEFPTIERAREWYRSPEYAEALKVRATALTRTLVLVDGASTTA
jgi:uncharacterized protein (DUF1330 family)